MCREKKSVVVAIRGTQSIADLVTDAVVHPESMESWLPQVVLSSFCYLHLHLSSIFYSQQP